MLILMTEVPSAIAAILEKAEALLARVDDSAEATATLAERALFPRGVPVPLTVYALRTAQIESLITGADALAHLDLHAGSLQAQLHPERPRASLLSQPIAERLAKAERLKAWWARSGEDDALALCAALFPNGEGRWLGLADMVRALRTELSQAIEMTRDDLTSNPEMLADDAEMLTAMAEKGTWFMDAMAHAASTRPLGGTGSSGPAPDAFGDA
jgi:hypothetical protein